MTLDMQQIQDATNQKIMAVVYTDGSEKYKKHGWGCHGYFYINEEPKKGAGETNNIITASGYVNKEYKDKFKQVTPIAYIDGCGSSLEDYSNNVAELKGCINAMRIAIQHNVAKLQVYTDSEYVRRGVEEWAHKARARNWIRQDGTTVPNNKFWAELLKLKDEMDQKGIILTVTWVKGHNNILGNELADRLAGIGTQLSLRNIEKHFVEYTKPEGYWKVDVPKPKLFANKRMVFFTDSAANQPGKYYMCDSVRGPKDIGTPHPEGTHSIVWLTQPDEILEKFRNIHSVNSNFNNTLVMGHIDRIFNSNIYPDLDKFGDLAMNQTNSARLDISALDGSVLSEELRPPKQAFQTMDELDKLEQVGQRFLDKLNNPENNDKFIHYMDITNNIYNKESKKKKEVEDTKLKIKPEITNLTKSIDITIKINEKDVLVKLKPGHDIPDRNMLKGLEDSSPNIYLVLDEIENNVYRYYTFITNDQGRGIYSGAYTNLIMLK